MLKKGLIFVSLITIKIPVTCGWRHLIMYPMTDPFTKWASEDEKIVFYTQSSQCGGTGKILIDGEYQYFFWNGDIYEGILCYFPETEATAVYKLESVGETIFSQPKNDEVLLYGKSADTPITGLDSVTIYKNDYDDELDAKNFIDTTFINDELNIRLHYRFGDYLGDFAPYIITTDSSFKKANYHGIEFKFLEDKHFSMNYENKISLGTYTTTKENISLIFEENQIFEIDGNNLELALKPDKYFY